MSIRLIKILCAVAVSFFLSHSGVSAAENDLSKLFATQSEFLKVDEAFQLTTEIVDDEIIARFVIADDYYMYRSRFLFSAENGSLGEAYIPRGKKKQDEYFGEVEVYYHQLEISVPYHAHQQAFTFIIEYQGCAEAGLCYPPEEKRVQLVASKITPSGTPFTQDTSTGSASTSANESSEVFVPEQEKVINFLTDKSLFEIIVYFVLLGIGLAFTPCVLPMVPILSSIIVGQGDKATTGKAFGLSLAYTQSMAIPYTLLGIFAGAAGSSLSNTLQEPLFIIIAAVVFILLSLSMFGFYELQLPQGMQNRLNNLSNSQQGGSYLGAAVMGAISALVVSPCVTVPLAGVLLYIAQTGDQVIGGLALYSLAFGMGIPLLIVGVGGNKLLPKAGAWMNAVKGTFGVGMLAMALYISKHLIPGPLYLAAWAILLIVSAIYMGALSQAQSGTQKLWKGLGVAFLIYGTILILGAAMGNGRLLSPLGNLSASLSASTQGGSVELDPHHGFAPVKTIADVEKAIQQANAQGKTVMFDFFAESCTACYEFAEWTFPDPKVKAALKDAVLIQADVTANDADDKALMKHYNVLGLPSILFFDLQGLEDKRLRAIGFEDADTFSLRIKTAFKQ